MRATPVFCFRARLTRGLLTDAVSLSQGFAMLNALRAPLYFWQVSSCQRVVNTRFWSSNWTWYWQFSTPSFVESGKHSSTPAHGRQTHGNGAVRSARKADSWSCPAQPCLRFRCLGMSPPARSRCQVRETLCRWRSAHAPGEPARLRLTLCRILMKIEGSVVFVTGGNRGLGLEFAKQALERGRARCMRARAIRPV
ncbi:hypothetical protein ABIE53_001018 [Burkholderia sp. OAS925]